MKSEIFNKAIYFRNMIRFVYLLNEMVVEPYSISVTKNGKKYLYARVPAANQVKRFEFSGIANIKVLKDKKFSPIIHINTLAS